MNRMIHRYEIGHALSRVQMPVGTKVLSVVFDVDNQIRVYAEIDADQEAFSQRTFLTVGTGEEFSILGITDIHKLTFIGTVLLPRTGHTWHIYEVN